ncbi:S8 family peptidase [Chelativorans sp. AA-79]|uniref:S8 family peptidase n=1 Tax=Chelativorans sp. AA-79 TaxID=3028735 RepID=UPI0023F8D27A|nr:S8 family peptidase [Chelativorans sp. AA-79]WEX09485.1 S8 family serine peptidase [Chelativorans sp. AA-79]
MTSTPEEPVEAPTGHPVMDETAASSYAAGSEFRRIDPGENCGTGCTGANNYELQNIHYAHTATLSNGQKVRGAGTLIAVVDDGFLTSHQELAGKSIDSTYLSTNTPLDHGTAVTSIVAGKADGIGMMGVAPEANLHLTSWENVAPASLVSHLTNATNDAAAKGAVAQNNSWGWDTEVAASQERTNYENSGASSYAVYSAMQRGGTPAQWQALFHAYDNFQTSGVIVVANSNESSLGDASAWTALPLFVPELSEAWIAVTNASFTLNTSDGSIRSATLLSAPCGSAARFCVTSDGTLAHLPTASGDDSYYQDNVIGTGTSFAAPQVSGQIALLAQAFPNLSPAEWTTRLLATARTDWAGFQSTIVGQQTFAPGVTHAYSSDYGHGVPDMKRALEPVGGLSVASGSNVFTAERTSLDGGVTTSGSVVGNSVAKALAGRSVMVVDALGTDFYVDGDELNGSGGSRAPSADAAHLSRNVDRIAASFAFVEAESAAGAGLHDAAVPKLFFSQTLANLEGDTAFSQLFPTEDGGYLQFSGQMQDVSNGGTTAFSVSRLIAREGFSSELSFSFGQSGGSFFGTEARGPFMAAENTGNLAAGVSISKALSAFWSVGAYAEFGSTFVDDDPSALVDYGSFAYASGGLTARRRDVFTGRDMLDFYAGVRPAAFAGEAKLRLPVGRDADGTIRYDDLSVDLADSDLPLRLGFVYKNRTEQDFDLLFGFNTDFLAGSDPEPVYSVSLGLKKEF